jgi:hypothetical protein
MSFTPMELLCGSFTLVVSYELVMRQIYNYKARKAQAKFDAAVREFVERSTPVEIQTKSEDTFN